MKKSKVTQLKASTHPSATPPPPAAFAPPPLPPRPHHALLASSGVKVVGEGEPLCVWAPVELNEYDIFILKLWQINGLMNNKIRRNPSLFSEVVVYGVGRASVEICEKRESSPRENCVISLSDCNFNQALICPSPSFSKLVIPTLKNIPVIYT